MCVCVCVCVSVCLCVCVCACVWRYCRLRFPGFSMRLVCFDPDLQGEGGCATSGSSSRSKRATISSEINQLETNSVPVKRLHAHVITGCITILMLLFYRERQKTQIRHYRKLFLRMPIYDFSQALCKFLTIKVELKRSTELSTL